jgi:predicted RNA-binding protein with PUA-like domain
MTMSRNFLLKTEPGTYSFETLAKEKKTNWNGVRNFQARNVLKECAKGDYALIYHSGDEKSVVGLAIISKDAYPDIDPKKPGDWVQVDLKYALKFKEPVTLATIKSTPALKALPLIKQSRLSCMEVTQKDFESLLKMGGAWADFQRL